MASKSILAFGFTIFLSFVLISCDPPQPASPSTIASLAAKLVQNDEKAMKAIEDMCHSSNIHDVCINGLMSNHGNSTEDRKVLLKILSKNVQAITGEIYSITNKLLTNETDPWTKDCLQACHTEYKFAQRYVNGIMDVIQNGDYKRVRHPMMIVNALAHQCQEHFDNPPDSLFGNGESRISPFLDLNGLVKALALGAATIAFRL
ncbi:putative cell wall / vacuolar inhibitor of fructosidase 2-like [Cocos nucifera]|uniref:Putative cell wall / vacuolar inhibitor of fructosidase 2-like n=1 Tax=Cocos nucifera TaxID=13894 RepID=A0A8K0MX59_COCNU|nr:putative cell wall / vacuolar inhibitor of fructosidase 2-like [Cocos nucifera]